MPGRSSSFKFLCHQLSLYVTSINTKGPVYRWEWRWEDSGTRQGRRHGTASADRLQRGGRGGAGATVAFGLDFRFFWARACFRTVIQPCTL